MSELDNIIEAIKKDYPEETKKGWSPILNVYEQSKILIIGQAPGLKTQLKNEVFKDQSGDRLRRWLNVNEEVFYHSKLISVLPLDFYFPGKGKTGDLPPNLDTTRKYHPNIIGQMKDLKLIILLGSYAVNYYLKETKKKNVTETVSSYKDYLPTFFPLVHPSPLNQRWMAKNPWFISEVIPTLQEIVQNILSE
ncbi:MAG: uracil-DNA glycosylase family protein [Erysipelothrix sp.]|nr:uracil-DNA glycosylase family protein [Erysipelothrix sp.]